MATHAHDHVAEHSHRHDDGGWARRVGELCAARGLQITPLRRQVIDIVADTVAPLTAYELIEKLARLQGRPVGPPTVYRTLDFLIENGFVVKIESRNAYARCDCPGHRHHGALLICAQCGRTDEIENAALEAALEAIAGASNFTIQRQVVELEGLCDDCRETAAA